MTLKIGSSITNGLHRVVNRNGLLLIVAAALLGVGWQVAITSIFAQFFPPTVTETLTLAIDAPAVVLGIVGVILFLLLAYISVIAMRTFVAGETDQISSEILHRRIPWVVANFIVGGLAYSLLMAVGTILLIVPGIIVYISLLFTSIYIAVEDENFVSAMLDSWHLTRGNWIRLFLLLAVIIIPFMIIFTVLSMAISIAFGANSAVSQIVSGLISMPFSILMLGIIAEAFVQLTAESQTERAEGDSGVDPTGEATGL